MDQMKVMLNTGTSIIQAFYEKKGSTLKEEYRNSTAIAFMDPVDMEKLSLKPLDKVDVISQWGQVTVFVDVSHDKPHEGMIFIPKGPWANIVISPETYCSNIPTFKALEVTIKKSQKEVLLVADLMRQTYQKYGDDTGKSLGQKPIYKRMKKC